MKRLIKKCVKPFYITLIKLRGCIKGVGFKHFGLTSNIISPIRILNKGNISIGEHVFILNGLRMETIVKWKDTIYSPEISIGDHVAIGQNCHFTCANCLKIGDGVSIFPNVLITDIEHEYVPDHYLEETGLEVGSVVIGDYTTIGMGARILGHRGITIGKNVVIGTNAVVTKDVPDGAIIVGSPFRIIGYNQQDEEGEQVAN